MLSPAAAIAQTCFIFAILLSFVVHAAAVVDRTRCNDPARGTEASFERWRTKFENLCGIGILIYVILLTDGAILWIMSLDVTWYSSIWGFQFLVGPRIRGACVEHSDGGFACPRSNR